MALLFHVGRPAPVASRTGTRDALTGAYLRLASPTTLNDSSMVKRKASAATPATPAVSSQSAGAARATAAAGQSVPQAAPRSGSSSSSASAPPTHYYQSGKDEYRVPKAWNDPLGYLRSVWDLYEATFAISMLETVSGACLTAPRRVLHRPLSDFIHDDRQWESILLRERRSSFVLTLPPADRYPRPPFTSPRRHPAHYYLLPVLGNDKLPSRSLAHHCEQSEVLFLWRGRVTLALPDLAV